MKGYNLFRFLDKFSTVTFSENLETACIQYNFGGIKINHKIKNRPLLNKYLCNKAGFKTLLISRFNGVGDFLLFRPFLKSVKMSKKYGNYKIILVSFSDYIGLDKKFYKNNVDYYIPVSHGKNCTKDIHSLLKGTSFNTYIDPADGLNLENRKDVAELIKADEKFCNIGLFTYSEAEKNGTDIEKLFKKYFDKLYYQPNCPVFVRDVYKAFFEYVLEEKIIDIDSLKNQPEFSVDFKSRYAVISPFAHGQDRTYSSQNYAVIIDYINDVLNIPVVILGGKPERNKSEKLVQLCKNPDKIINLTGRLSYYESMFYIKNADFLVANETGTVHMAQEFGTKTICISNGTYMGTFHPYPEEISSAVYVYPDNIDEILKEHPEYAGVYFESNFEQLSPEKVIDVIKTFV